MSTATRWEVEEEGTHKVAYAYVGNTLWTYRVSRFAWLLRLKMRWTRLRGTTWQS